MRRVSNRSILLVYLLLIAVILAYRLNLLGIGDAIAHVWPPLIVALAIIALALFGYLTIRAILYRG